MPRTSKAQPAGPSKPFMVPVLAALLLFGGPTFARGAVDTLGLEAFVAQLGQLYGAKAAAPAKCAAQRCVHVQLEPRGDRSKNPELSVRADRYVDKTAASRAYATTLSGADTNTGLSYAWDHVLRVGATVYRLHAPCRWGKPRWKGLVADFEGSLGAADQRFSCACGGGCSPSE